LGSGYVLSSVEPEFQKFRDFFLNINNHKVKSIQARQQTFLHDAFGSLSFKFLPAAFSS